MQSGIPPMERAAALLQPVARWTAGRKARRLDAIRLGIVTEGDVLDAHKLDLDELNAWRRHRNADGVPLLRIGSMISPTRRA